LSRILYSRGIAGLIIAPTSSARGRLTLDWARFSCVTVGYSLIRPDLHRVAPHHFHSILNAERKLRRMGYNRIGLCIYKNTSARVDDLWLAGALLCQHRRTASPLKMFFFDESKRRSIPDWARAENIEVIVSDNPQAVAELQRVGIRVP